jgi:hypothetical protein
MPQILMDSGAAWEKGSPHTINDDLPKTFQTVIAKPENSAVQVSLQHRRTDGRKCFAAFCISVG